MSTSKQPDVQLGPRGVVFAPPNPNFPFYHLRIELRVESIGKPEFDRSLVNDQRIRDWSLWFEGVQEKTRGFADREGLYDLILRYDWHAAQHIQIKLCDPPGNTFFQTEATAPANGGRLYPDMPYYFSLVLRDVGGTLERIHPVHTTVCLYDNQVADPARQLFAVQFDKCGAASVIPHQVSDIQTWSNDALIEEEPYRYQGSVTFELVVLARLLANQECVVLIFYGADPPSATQLKPTLSVKLQGDLAAVVDNPFWTLETHGPSGQIDQILLKSTGETMEHHAEPEGTVHWNPDVYAPPANWARCCEWDPPDGHAWEIGPHAARFQRWGRMRFGIHQVKVNVTYWFYGLADYCIQTSSIHITESLAVKSLRNGEVVFNHALFNALAWQDRDGQVSWQRLDDVQRHPKHGLRLDARCRWIAFTNLQTGTSFALIPLELSGYTTEGGAARLEAPYYYLAYGPWFYLSRALVYPFGSNNPQRMLMLSPGSIYFERNAFYPTRLDCGCRDRYAPIELLARSLVSPPTVRMVMQTDERVPEKWVEPIVEKPFRELEEHLIFKPGESSSY